MNLISIILPIYTIIFLGYGLRRIEMISFEGMKSIKAILLNVAVPCLLFHGLATANMAQIDVVKPYILLYGMTAVGFIAMFVFSQRVIKLANDEAAMMTLSSVFPNIIYIGFPMTLHLLGEDALPLYFALVLFHNFVTVVPSCVLVEASRADKSAFTSLFTMLIKISLSPMILSLFLALAFRQTGLALPSFVESSLKSLGALAMPLALIILGAEFIGFRLRGNIAHACIIALTSNVIMPVSAYFVGKHMLGMSGMPLNLVTLLLVTPMGLLPYMIATQYNVYVRRAMSGFLLSNAFAPLTMTGLLWAFGIQA